VIEMVAEPVAMPVPGWSRSASQLCHRAVSRVIASACRHHCAHQRNSPPSGRRNMGRKWLFTHSSTLP
jgi:hypothetical protein